METELHGTQILDIELDLESAEQRHQELQDELAVAKATLSQTLDSLKGDLAAKKSEIEFTANTVAMRSAERVVARLNSAKDSEANCSNHAPSTMFDVKRKLNELNPDEQVDLEKLQETLLCNEVVKPLVRVGRMAIPAAEAVIETSRGHFPNLAAYIPLLDSGHLAIECDSSNENLGPLLQNIVGQALLAAPGRQIKVKVFDPRNRGFLSAYLPSGSEDVKAVEAIDRHTDGLEKELEVLSRHSVSVQASRASRYSSLGDYIRETRLPEHQFVLLVILDAPERWSKKIQDELDVLLESGTKDGISLILQYPPQPKDLPRQEISVAEVLRHSRYLSLMRFETGTARWQLKPQGLDNAWFIKPDAAPEPDEQKTTIDLVTEAAKKGSLPSVSLRDIIAGAPQWRDKNDDYRSSAEGVTITLGKKGQTPIEFELGSSKTNINHILVGGQTGSGKTVLLKALIYSLADRYSPDELKFFLLDYKDGVEFQQFAPKEGAPLPHAEVVSMESDAAFGVAVLRYFSNELNRRSSEFKKLGDIGNLAAYRPEGSDRIMPRWVLVVDEFQKMFDGPEAAEATRLLTDIAKRGRSFGLHLVMATQSLEKLSGLKGVFENTRARIALQLSREESQAFLSTNNTAAADLTLRGEAILNLQSGNSAHNTKFIVGYENPEDDPEKDKVNWYRVLQERLWQTELARSGDKAQRPIVFKGDDYARAGKLLEEYRQSHQGHGPGIEHDDEIPVWYGRERSVTGAVATTHLTHLRGSNIAVLGGADTAAAIATVQTMVLTAAAAAGKKLSIMLLDGIYRQYRSGAYIEEWVELLISFGCDVQVFAADKAKEFLEALKSTDSEGRRLAVLLGAEHTEFQALAEAGRASEQWWSENLRSAPAALNLNVIGQWSSWRDMPKFKPDDWATLLFVGATAGEVTDAAKGTYTSQVPDILPNRTLVFSRISSQHGIQSVNTIAPFNQMDNEGVLHDDLGAWTRLAQLQKSALGV